MSLNDDKDFSNAFNMCSARLKVNNYLTNSTEVNSMSRRSGMLSHEMYYSILEIMNKFSKYNNENEVSSVEKNKKKTMENWEILDDDSNHHHHSNEYLPAADREWKVEEVSVDDYGSFEPTECDNDNDNISETDSWSIVDIVDEQDSSLVEDKKFDINSNNFLNLPNIRSCHVVLSNSSKVQSYINKLEEKMDNKKFINNSWLKQEEALHKRKKPPRFTSFEEKVRIVNLHQENPTWSLRELRKKGDCKTLCSSKQLEIWKDQVHRGDDHKKNIKKKINDWVHKQCIEYAEKTTKKITGKLLIQWGLEAKKIYSNEKMSHEFNANRWWAYCFRKTYFPSLTDVKPRIINIKKPSEAEKEQVKRLYLPHEMKVKVVQMARDNPSWSIQTLREKSGCRFLENKETLNSWKKLVNYCATPAERRDVIYQTIIEKCKEYQKGDRQFNDELLIQWASEACQECLPSTSAIRHSSRFYRSSEWLTSFKNAHNITGPSDQLKITGPVLVKLDSQEKNNDGQFGDDVGLLNIKLEE